MGAPVTTLKATADLPPLKPGDTTALLKGCEARVRHAADKLDAAAVALRDLREMVRRAGRPEADDGR